MRGLFYNIQKTGARECSTWPLRDQSCPINTVADQGVGPATKARSAGVLSEGTLSEGTLEECTLLEGTFHKVSLLENTLQEGTLQEHTLQEGTFLEAGGGGRAAPRVANTKSAHKKRPVLHRCVASNRLVL